jgi:hypothetical protein
MTNREIPTLDRYWASLDEALPVFTPEEQRVAVALYRELAKGAPVTVERLAAVLEVPSATAGELIGRDAAGRMRD